MADSTYDGIILGTGHNSLILQAYLCRAGLRVISLDRNAVPGGGLRTEEWPVGSGFLHNNTHSFYHRGVTRMPWYADLELERHGARYLEPDLNVAMLLPDGHSLTWWTDFERTSRLLRSVQPPGRRYLAPLARGVPAHRDEDSGTRGAGSPAVAPQSASAVWKPRPKAACC